MTQRKPISHSTSVSTQALRIDNENWVQPAAAGDDDFDEKFQIQVRVDI